VQPITNSSTSYQHYHQDHYQDHHQTYQYHQQHHNTQDIEDGEHQSPATTVSAIHRKI
jgi:hypothetical protein